MSKPWRILRFDQPQFAKQIAALNRHAEPSPARADAVAGIIAAVRKEGDEALVKYTKKFDNIDLSKKGFVLPSRKAQPAPDMRAAIDYALKNIRSFSKLR